MAGAGAAGQEFCSSSGSRGQLCTQAASKWAMCARRRTPTAAILRNNVRAQPILMRFCRSRASVQEFCSSCARVDFAVFWLVRAPPQKKTRNHLNVRAPGPFKAQPECSGIKNSLDGSSRTVQTKYAEPPCRGSPSKEHLPSQTNNWPFNANTPLVCPSFLSCLTGHPTLRLLTTRQSLVAWASGGGGGGAPVRAC